MSKYIDELIGFENEDNEWEYWLHKIWDKSFEEYKALIIDKTEKADMRIDFEATIKESYSIIADFVPE